MKITYLTHRNAEDKREWSGTMYSMAQSLRKHAGEVVYAGPYDAKIIIILLKIINKLSLWVFRKRYNIPYSYMLSLVYKYYFEKKIKKQKPDIVVAVSSSGEMSLLKLNCPIIYVGDITFRLLIDRYPNFTNLSKISIWESEIIEKKTFQNASAIVVSSEWAAHSAYTDYNLPKEKVHIISYGSNMEKIPTLEDIKNKKIQEPIKILFLGVDWIRKGGETVIETMDELKAMGLNVELTICGCIPPQKHQKDYTKVVPFLDKNINSDFIYLYNIMLESNFLFVPSKSDCTPISFCEANAFGLPVLTTDVGGIPSVVIDGINGHTFPLNTKPKVYAEKISHYIQNTSEYFKFSLASRNYYDKYLNWDQWGQKMNDLFKKTIDEWNHQKEN